MAGLVAVSPYDELRCCYKTNLLELVRLVVVHCIAGLWRVWRVPCNFKCYIGNGKLCGTLHTLHTKKLYDGGLVSLNFYCFVNIGFPRLFPVEFFLHCITKRGFIVGR